MPKARASKKQDCFSTLLCTGRGRIGFLQFLVFVVVGLGIFVTVRQYSFHIHVTVSKVSLDRVPPPPELLAGLARATAPVEPPEVENGELGSAHQMIIVQLRQSISAWLDGVATFQEVAAVDTLRTWFDRAPLNTVLSMLENLTLHDDAAGWQTCAVEGETCHCPSGKVRYGHTERKWLPKEGVTEIACTLGSWNNIDVAVGMIKQCQCFYVLGKDAGVEELVDEASLPGTLQSLLEQAHEEAKGLASPRRGPGVRRPEPTPGGLWHFRAQVASWVRTSATFEQLVAAARLYKWLENTRSTATITVALEKAATWKPKEPPMCGDGQPEDRSHCAGHGELPCRLACVHKDARVSQVFHPRSTVVSRADLCSGGVPYELLWSCDREHSRLPAEGHPHAAAQEVLEYSTKDLCGVPQLRPQLEVYLDCEFLPNYLRWTTSESEWIEEAYVSYVAGGRDSKYEWQATNLVRSIDVFSSKPLIMVVFDNSFVPPLSWYHLPNIIVFKMKPIIHHHMHRAVSFNFNKIRAMISTRVVVGIELDTDQIIAPGMDQLFAGTRREITERYPWPMMPVHWMSRDAKEGEPYHNYRFQGYSGSRSMRWGHAHPSWSFWALPFLGDMLNERYTASMATEATVLRPWNLSAAVEHGLMYVFRNDIRAGRRTHYDIFMQEDEDMLNVALWRDGVNKEWCKYDLEFSLFKQARELDKDLYWDAQWFPDGVPVIFISMHNTKVFEETDWLLTMIALCDRKKPPLHCTASQSQPNYCKDGSTEERRFRKQPESYASHICCCFEPRERFRIYWAQKWYENSSQVPTRATMHRRPDSLRRDRLCIMP